ncbi:MAG: hypothetical protein HY075_10465 [Deltaproteobacteria bacterium]|nr:hypothetical protein [Deltaproteobacteria bacterium]
MKYSAWSWWARILFVFVGMLLGGFSMFAAYADDGIACATQSIPGVAEVGYDAYGRLAKLENLQDGSEAHVMFDAKGKYLSTIGVNRLRQFPSKDKKSTIEKLFPHHWAEYAPDGRMTHYQIYTASRQLDFEIPADLDLESLRDPQSHEIVFTGAPKSCDSYFSNCKTLEPRKVVVESQLHASKDSCVEFAGMRFAVQRGGAQPPVAAPKIESQAPAPKQLPNQPGADIPVGPKDRKVCIEGGCIIVHEDDQGADQTDAE